MRLVGRACVLFAQQGAFAQAQPSTRYPAARQVATLLGVNQPALLVFQVRRAHPSQPT
jgi:hypothetical protein